MKLIDSRRDPWHPVVADEAAPAVRSHALLTLAQWEAVRAAWPLDVPVGVLLANTDDVRRVAADLPRLGLIALDFPKWTDGRAYSQAWLLRARLGYTGEIRATGDVVLDMMPLLRRTGFDAAVLRPGQSREAAQRALGFFEGHYQRDAVATGATAATASAASTAAPAPTAAAIG